MLLDARKTKSTIRLGLYTCAAQLSWISGITSVRKLPVRENSLRILMYHKVCDELLSALNIRTALFRRHQE